MQSRRAKRIDATTMRATTPCCSERVPGCR